MVAEAPFASADSAFRFALISGNTEIMTKTKTVLPKKRGRGRPATGVDPVLTVRLPDELIEQLEAFAKKRSLTRSDAIRQCIEMGIRRGRK